MSSSADKTATVDADRPTPTRRRIRLAIALIAAVVIGVPGGYYVTMMFITGNFHPVVEGQVYRSRQPRPGDLTRWVEKHGIASVLCLRGREYPGDEQEQAEAHRLGVDFRAVRTSAYRQLSRYEAIDIIEQIEQAPKPLLIHCRAGADRTGTASVIAQMALGGESYAEALDQLHWRYLHIGWYKVHVEEIFDQYERWCAANGLGTGGWEQFRDYVMNHYYPRFYHVRIDAPQRLTLRAGESTTLEIPVTVEASQAIPADEIEFALACFEGEYAGDYKERILGGPVPLPDRSIAPGETITLEMTISIPADESAGPFEVGFDIEQVDRLWFGRMGSPVPRAIIEVLPAEGAETAPDAESETAPAAGAAATPPARMAA